MKCSFSLSPKDFYREMIKRDLSQFYSWIKFADSTALSISRWQLKDLKSLSLKANERNNQEPLNSNTSSPLSFPCEHSKSTDATNSNDFRQVVVTVMSQKSTKRRMHSQALHVCVHIHDLLVPQNVFSSFLANHCDHLFKTVQYIWTWITLAWSRECYTHEIFRWFLWL